MDSEGLNVRRLTTVGNWNDAPAWNPSKQFSEIAYTSRLEAGRELRHRRHRPGHPAGPPGHRRPRELRVPVVGPNGRHLVFSCKRGSTWQITVADREGRVIDTLSRGRRQQRAAGLGS